MKHTNFNLTSLINNISVALQALLQKPFLVFTLALDNERLIHFCNKGTYFKYVAIDEEGAIWTGYTPK